MHHAHRVFDRDTLDACGLSVNLGAAQAGQNQRGFAMHQMAAIELGSNVYCQVALAQCLPGLRGVWRGRRKIAAQCEEHFCTSVQHGLD